MSYHEMKKNRIMIITVQLQVVTTKLNKTPIKVVSYQGLRCYLVLAGCVVNETL